MTVLHRIIRAILYISLGVGISYLFIFFYWAVYPYKTIDIKSPMKVINEGKIVDDGNLRYEVDYVKYTREYGEVSKVLVNTILVPFVPYISKVKAGKGKKVIGIHIPDWYCEGSAKLKVTLSYKVNYFRTISKTFETEEFQIVKRKKDDES